MKVYCIDCKHCLIKVPPGYSVTTYECEAYFVEVETPIKKNTFYRMCDSHNKENNCEKFEKAGWFVRFMRGRHRC